jgi:hypothetical protein
MMKIWWGLFKYTFAGLLLELASVRGMPSMPFARPLNAPVSWL